jgi:hypothetical protein
MQYWDHLHIGLPISRNRGILRDYLYGADAGHTDKTDRSRQLSAMSWSWETSSTCKGGPAPTCSRGLRIDPRYVQPWTGPRRRESALEVPQAASTPADCRFAGTSARGAAPGIPDGEKPAREDSQSFSWPLGTYGPIERGIWRSVVKGTGSFCASKSTSLRFQERSTRHHGSPAMRRPGSGRLQESRPA